MVVADLIWVATQRAAGQDYVFIPYSTAVGGLLVPKQRRADAPRPRGGKIGIAGGPIDKLLNLRPMPSRNTASISRTRPSRYSERRR